MYLTQLFFSKIGPDPSFIVHIFMFSLELIQIQITNFLEMNYHLQK